MFDLRFLRTSSSLLLLLLAAAACGESTETEHNPPIRELPDALPAVVSFQAAPASIEAGEPCTLEWTTRNAATIRIVDEAGAELPLGDAAPAHGSVEIRPSETTNYTLHATGIGTGTGGEEIPVAWASATVTVTPTPVPLPLIESFTASASTVPVGGEVVLSWRTSHATALSLKDDTGVELLEDSAPAEGQVTVTPTRATTSYYLVAVGPSGRASASVVVGVAGAPRIARFFVDPIVPVHVGGTVTVVWETIHADRVVIRQGEAVLVDTTTEPSGSREVALADTTSFALEATGPGGAASASLLARVGPTIVSFVADERVVRPNDPVEFRWEIVDADRAVIDGPDDFHRAIGAAELATGGATVHVAAAGDFVLQAFRGDVPVRATIPLDVTLAPRIRSFEVDRAQVTAAPDQPATVTLSWNQDGGEVCTLLANNAAADGYLDFPCAGTGSATVQVRGDTTFRLVVRNGSGSHEATVAVQAVAPARIVAFTPTPNRRLTPGDAVRLGWTVTDAVAISLEKNDTPVAVPATDFTGTITDRVDFDSVYVLTAVNSLNTPTHAEVTVRAGVPEILSVVADPDFVAIGTSFALRWTANGGDRLAVTDGAGTELFSTTDPAIIDAGSTAVLAPVAPGTYTYTVSSTNGAGTVQASATVTVSDGPMIGSFTASPLQISLGEDVTFTWSVSNDAAGNPPSLALADDYGHSYPDIATKNQNNGTLVVEPLEEGRHVFTLTASTPNTTPHRVSVVVEVTVPPFLHVFTATPDSVYTQGGTVVPNVELAWQSENAVEFTLWEADAAGNVTPPPFHRVSLAAGDPQAALDAGSLTVHPTATTWYVARAKNRVGTQVQRLVKVTVDPPEVLTFAAAPVEIAEGSTAQLSWTTRGATAVRLDPMPPSVTRLGNTFVDISTAPGAVQSTLTGDYGLATVVFPAGFTFPFAGTVYDRIQVCSNGWAGFNPSNTDSAGYSSALPSTSRFANFLLYGGDHDNTYNAGSALWSGIATDAQGDFLVLQWKNWSWWSSSYRPSDLNFELILRPNGNFEFRYGVMTSNVPARANGLGANLGFQYPAAGSYGMNLVPNGTEVPNGLAGTGWAFDLQLPVNGSFPVSPTATTTYTLTALNADASAQATASVTVWKNPVLANVRTVPSAPVATQPFKVEWTATNATRVRVLDEAGVTVCDITDPALIATGNCTVVAATQGPKTWSIVADNGPPGVAIATLTRPFGFSVFPYLAVTSLTVAPGEFANAGDQVTLTYATAGAVEVMIEACVPRTITCVDITPPNANPVSGSVTYTMATSQEFRVHAYDMIYREDVKAVSVWVGAGSLDTLTASTTQIVPGGSTTLSWTSTDQTTVSLSPQLPVTASDVSAIAPYQNIFNNGGTVVSTREASSSADSGRYRIDFPAGFSFPWFGSAATGVKMSVDGWLTFDMASTYGGGYGYTFPTTSSTYQYVHMAPFWDDLEAVSPGAIVWKLETPAVGPRYLILQWHDWELYYDSASSLNFQVVLFENGDFDFRYGTMTGTGTYVDYARGSSATIGFQNQARTIGNTLSHNTVFTPGLTGKSFRYRPLLPLDGSVTVSPTTTTTYRVCSTNASLYEACREIRIVVVQPGDLLFSEAMIAPADDQAEWFELVNMSPEALDLAGWVLSSGTETYPIPAAPPLVVQPGGRVTFARSGSATNGGFTPDVVYGNVLTLDNAADTLTLFLSGVPVDQIAWGAGWTIPANQSLAVEPTLLTRNPAANDPFAAWCPTASLYGNNTYGGSPGTQGSGCLPPAP